MKSDNPQEAAGTDTCPKCKHRAHGSWCPNMASDNDCSCTFVADAQYTDVIERIFAEPEAAGVTEGMRAWLATLTLRNCGSEVEYYECDFCNGIIATENSRFADRFIADTVKHFAHRLESQRATPFVNPEVEYGETRPGGGEWYVRIAEHLDDGSWNAGYGDTLDRAQQNFRKENPEHFPACRPAQQEAESGPFVKQVGKRSALHRFLSKCCSADIRGGSAANGWTLDQCQKCWNRCAPGETENARYEMESAFVTFLEREGLDESNPYFRSAFESGYDARTPSPAPSASGEMIVERHTVERYVEFVRQVQRISGARQFELLRIVGRDNGG